MTTRTRARAWTLLAIGALTLPAAARAQDLDALLSKARDGAGRGAWSALEGGLRLTGETDTGGEDAAFTVYLAADGRYRYQLDGRLALTVTFDGEEVAERVRSGPTLALGRGDREEWHLNQWLHSGYWSEPACPLEIELVEETAEGAVLRLSLPGASSSSLLSIDRETGLPSELRRTTAGGESIQRFREYAPVAGVPVAHLVESEAHGRLSTLRVIAAAPAPPDPGTRYLRDRGPAADVQFDLERGPQVEMKRVRSGHLLVHPLVDGRDVGWFILDSGAGQNCIDPTVAEGLELERFGTVPAVGVAGAVQTGYRQAASLELGPLRIEDPVFVELDLSFLAAPFGVEVGGICGFDVFARAVVVLDLAETHLELFEPGTFELGDDAWQELVLDSRVPSVRGRFEGDREGLFKIDLGDAGTISFYSPAVESLGLLEGREVRDARVGGVGGAGSAKAGELAWFELAGHRFEPLPVLFSRTEVGAFSASHALGNLGTRMLEPFVVVLDYENARVGLLPRE